MSVDKQGVDSALAMRGNFYEARCRGPKLQAYLQLLAAEMQLIRDLVKMALVPIDCLQAVVHK